MNAFLNNSTLTETQKNALFAFGELDKTGTGVNLMIAASMCEGDLIKAILMNLSDLVRVPASWMRSLSSSSTRFGMKRQNAS